MVLQQAAHLQLWLLEGICCAVPCQFLSSPLLLRLFLFRGGVTISSSLTESCMYSSRLLLSSLASSQDLSVMAQTFCPSSSAYWSQTGFQSPYVSLCGSFWLLVKNCPHLRTHSRPSTYTIFLGCFLMYSDCSCAIGFTVRALK